VQNALILIGAIRRMKMKYMIVDCIHTPTGRSFYHIPLKSVLSLTDEKPLFGNRDTKKKNTHWIVFMKGEKS